MFNVGKDAGQKKQRINAQADKQTREMKANTQKLVRKISFIEHVDSIKVNKGDISNINTVRENKRVHLTYESLGMSVAKLRSSGSNDLEPSSVSCLLKENAKRSSDFKGDRINKASYKARNNFMKWLRLKKVKVRQDFKEKCKQKYKCDENEDALCIK